MLRLRPFEVQHPATLEEAVTLLSAEGARVIAGGTDLMPNLKLRMVDAQVVVSLARIRDFAGVTRTPDGVVIGAGTRLIDVAEDPHILAVAPALAYACSRIASPPIRNVGTLGGNLALDTRCKYINQSPLWRQALGGCLKSHGAECHVVPAGAGCVAAMSADSVPVLIAYGASVTIQGPDGQRTAPVEALYSKDGISHVTLARGELIRSITVPEPPADTTVGYRKWAVREAIDFPLVSVALRLTTANDTLQAGLAVVGVLGPQPKRVNLDGLKNTLLADLPAAAAAWVFKKCRPLANVPYNADYRRERLAIETVRLAQELTRSPNP